MNTKLCIFDLDGTLTDSIPLIMHCFHLAYLDVLGEVPRTDEDLMSYIGKPLMTTFNVYSMARNNQFDSSKAKEELGYTTRTYEETIHDMVEWLLAEGIIVKEE